MKYQTPICKDDMTFQECELAIVRNAIDENGDKIREKNIIKNQNIKDIIKCLEDFLIRKRLVCYGGTAINNILPKHAQFYDYTKEIPDYDFYSPNALDDAIELADIYNKKGYKHIEAKAGVHYGTFKVYVEFTAIADITMMPKELFKNIQSSAKRVAGILYCPPDFLRMNMYLELSRPLGDITRWEKVYKRLSLLNEYYPLKVDVDCNAVDFQRNMGAAENSEYEIASIKNMSYQEKIYTILRDAFIDENVVFFGGYASSLYGKYMPLNQQKRIKKIPDFEVLSEDPERVCIIVKERFEDAKIHNVKIIKRDPVGEIIPIHYEIRIGEDILAHVYEPLACHSYNEYELNSKVKIRVGTIDTLLTFYLSFIYVNKPYYYANRILCMAKFLFDVQEHNKLKQVGILRRFTTDCIGNQQSLEDILMEKREKFKELKDKKGSREYNMWFLKYTPSESFKLSSEDSKIYTMTPLKQNDNASSSKESVSTSISIAKTPRPRKRKTLKKNKKHRVTVKHKSPQFGWL